MSQTILLTSNQLKNSPYHFDDEYACGVCRDSIGEDTDSAWFIHNDEQGKKHPLHKRCMEYTLRTDKCAVCRQKVDLSSILSPTEKLAKLAKLFVSDTSDALIDATKIFLVDFVASVAIVGVASVFSSSISFEEVGAPLLKFSLGFSGQAKFLYYLSDQINRGEAIDKVKFITRALGVFAYPLAYDQLIAGGNAPYAVYGAVSATLFSPEIYFASLAAYM